MEDTGQQQGQWWRFCKEKALCTVDEGCEKAEVGRWTIGEGVAGTYPSIYIQRDLIIRTHAALRQVLL